MPRPPTAPRTATLRTHLIAMVLIATLPLAALVGYQIVDAAKREDQLLRENLQTLTRAIATTVDREVGASAEVLAELARADAWSADDADALQVALEAALEAAHALRPSWSGVFVLDAGGSVLVDSRPGRDAAPQAGLPSPARAAALLRASRPGNAALSNLLDGAGGVPRWTALTLPVVRPDGSRLLLGATIGVDVWQRLMERSGAPAGGGVVTLFDAQRRVIARTVDAERFVGRALPAQAASAIGAHASGVRRARLLDGSVADSAWETIDHGGWTVGVSMPLDALEAAHRHSVLLALASALGCLALGVALAMRVARHVVQPLARLARPGHAPAAGEWIGVTEIATLRDALADAARQRESAAQRLAAKADEFEALFQASPLGLAFAQDPQCRVVLRNRAMDRLVPPSTDGSGPTPAGPGSGPQVLRDGVPLAPDDQPLRRAAMCGETLRGVEIEVRMPGQPTRFVLTTAVPLRDADGRLRGAISAHVDITHRKLAELRLSQSERRLRESQDLVELAEEVGDVGFFGIDWPMQSIDASAGLARLLGVDTASERRVDLHALWRERVEVAERERVEAAVRALAADSRRGGTLEFRIGDGAATRWLQTRLRIEYRDDGRPLRIVGLAIDVSAQKAAERERAELMAREQTARLDAEAANRAKDEFLSMLSHELRNPLNAVATAVQVLNRADADAPDAVSARQIILRQTRKLATMLEDLLDVGRVIGGDVKLLRQPLNLAPLVQRCVLAARGAAAERRQTLVDALADTWVHADAQRVAQMVGHLLDNAVKHSPAGGRIDVSLAAHAGSAVLRVHDAGASVPQATLERMFEPFVQGERGLDRAQGGLGIGLTLVRRLVEMHGGAALARSTPDGSVFEVRLPLVDAPGAAADARVPAGGARRGADAAPRAGIDARDGAPDLRDRAGEPRERAPAAHADRADRRRGGAADPSAAADAPASAQPAGAGAAATAEACAAVDGGVRRVAVIDDNPDALFGLRSLLSIDGHAVMTAADGPDGLALLLDAAPDIAIVDIGLPGIDGYEVARRSRAGGYRGRLIALSGYGRPRDLERSRSAGFETHLVKPVDTDALLRLLALP